VSASRSVIWAIFAIGTLSVVAQFCIWIGMLHYVVSSTRSPLRKALLLLAIYVFCPMARLQHIFSSTDVN
jgi:hypothetical protein